MAAGIPAAAESDRPCVKVVYDFERPNWLTYGHALFMDAGATMSDATAAIHRLEGDDVTITRLELQQATGSDRERFEAKQRRLMQWLERTRTGQPNHRADL